MYDTVVVGLGAVGSAALYQLSKSGKKILGIDKYNPPHTYGSSYGESRITRQAIGEGSFYTPLALRSNEIWKELEKLSGEQVYNHSGMVIAGYEEQTFIQNTIKAAKKYAIPHKLLDAKEAVKLFPALKNPNDDQVYYYEPDAGFLIPEKCIEVQLQAAKNNGVEVMLNTNVESFEETVDAVKIKLVNNEIIYAKNVIVASGPWIKDMFPKSLGSILKTYLQTFYWFDIDKNHYKDLTPEAFPVFLCGFEKASQTRAYSGFPAISGIDKGIKFTMDESEIEVTSNTKDSFIPNPKSAKDLYEVVSRYVKYIQPNILKSFNCVYTATPDWDFLIDYLPDSKRILLASPCSSHGFKHSSAVGEILAELAENGESKTNINNFRLSRFTQ